MKNASLIGRIAAERIGILTSFAEEKTLENSVASRALAKRYAKLALRISEHYKTKLPEKARRSICKGCGNFLIPGLNCSVRIASSHGYAVYTCECGREKHIFYKKRRR